MADAGRGPVVVIHQPQYLPYLGYFYKMSLGDVFVHLDTAAFSRNKVQNRNAIRGASGPQALTVPVLHHGRFGQPIAEVEVDTHQPWARKHWRTIEQAYHRYPHFDRYAGPLREVYERPWRLLVDLNIQLTALLMEWLELRVTVVRSSQLPVSGRGTELLVDICRHLGAATYVSGEGGLNYLEPERFAEAGIALRVSRFRHPVYVQPVEPFQPDLSALDVVMCQGSSASRVLAAAADLSELADWAPATT